MSYDIHLKDPVTQETAEVPGHLMIGGTYRADYHPETKTFTPALNTEAWLNITYNYGRYYREVYERGIRTIYGMSGLDSLSVLEKMINYLEGKYKIKGEWISTKRKKTICYDRNGKVIEDIAILLQNDTIEKTEEIEHEVFEGDTSDYWLPTAANAIRPLYQLMTLAKMRPDCIWEGD